MEQINAILQIILHLDQYLQLFIAHYDSWTYLLLFIIIFCESGIILTPFLPGDSLLFAAGSLCAITTLNVHYLAILLLIAATTGVAFNYWLGSVVGPKIFSNKKSLLFNPKHVEKTHAFYEKHGGKAIILCRFIPVIRTYAPFIAGIGKMNYRQFLLFNILGAFLWIGLILYAGYFFGNVPVVKNNFSLVIIGIIFVSFLPAIISLARSRVKRI